MRVEDAVHRQREGLERRAGAEAGEDVRHRPPLVVAALGADVVEAGAVADLDLEHVVEARRRRPRLEQGQVGPGLDPDDVVQDGVRALVLVQIDQRDRSRDPASGADQHAVGGAGGVEHRVGPDDGIVPRASSVP